MEALFDRITLFTCCPNCIDDPRPLFADNRHPEVNPHVEMSLPPPDDAPTGTTHAHTFNLGPYSATTYWQANEADFQ